MSGSDTVRGLQERAARALPAEQIRKADGWWLRYAPGCSWWVGTVLPHGDARPAELARRIAGAEGFYAGYGKPARFQVSPGACPDGLDTVLAERGYRRHSMMSLQVASTAGVSAQAPINSLRIRVDEHPTRAWFATWHLVHAHGGDVRSEWDMLNRVQLPCAYACALSGDDVLAVARAVCDTGWAGVFGMVTIPGARGKGVARTLLAALAGWAGDNAATRMYLQVERDNVPALRLYERLGFHEISRYHYRTAP